MQAPHVFDFVLLLWILPDLLAQTNVATASKTTRNGYVSDILEILPPLRQKGEIFLIPDMDNMKPPPHRHLLLICENMREGETC